MEAPATESSDVIGERFAPQPHADVVFVELDGELVISAPISDQDQFRFHWLDVTATLVWKLFDGVTSLAELADELSDVFNEDRRVVLNDIVVLTRTLGDRGMLEGIARRPSPSATRQMELPVGSPIPEASFETCDGDVISTRDLQGRDIVLVNWRPGCSDCASIAGGLAALLPALEARGQRLVLVAAASPAVDLSLLERSGLICTVVRNCGYELFAGFGTPAAYLVDASGEIASDLTIGSVEVLALVRRLAGVEDRA